jgi:hypothetical protein
MGRHTHVLSIFDAESQSQFYLSVDDADWANTWYAILMGAQGLALNPEMGQSMRATLIYRHSYNLKEAQRLFSKTAVSFLGHPSRCGVGALSSMELYTQVLHSMDLFFVCAAVRNDKGKIVEMDRLDWPHATQLAKLTISYEELAGCLRVLVAGRTQMRLKVSDLLAEDTVSVECITRKLVEKHPELAASLKIYALLDRCMQSRGYHWWGSIVVIKCIQYHEKFSRSMTTPAYSPLNDLVHLSSQSLLGAKLRFLPLSASSWAGSRRPLELRAVPIAVVHRFHTEYPGNNSRSKQHQMLADVQVSQAARRIGAAEDEVYKDGCAYGRMKPSELPSAFVAGTQYAIWLYPRFEHDKTFPAKSKCLIDGKHLQHNPKQCDKMLSWVEWAAEKNAGPADLLISYSWSLNWTYLIAFMDAVFGKEVCVWIDILACGQHQIERGAMDEISLLPEVLDYAGKTVVMPGTVARMWCNYEFGWSVELNGMQLFYADYRSLNDELKGQVEAQISREVQQNVDTLILCDQRLLALPGALLLEYPDVDVDIEAVEDLEVAVDGTKGAFLGKRPDGVCIVESDGLPNSATIKFRNQQHKVLMYKSAKEVEIAGTALKLCGRCWNPNDAEYIRNTIQERLGGSMQVCLTIKDALGVKVAAGLKTDVVESGILTRLFLESKGPTWANKEKWCSDEAPIQDWFGVRVTNGHVTCLDLPRSGIVFLSPALHYLADLRTINLQDNLLDAQKIADMIKMST